MYDFYPEWGPARHRGDEQPAVRRPRYWQPTAPALAMMGATSAPGPEQRDADGDRPDDN